MKNRNSILIQQIFLNSNSKNSECTKHNFVQVRLSFIFIHQYSFLWTIFQTMKRKIIPLRHQTFQGTESPIHFRSPSFPISIYIYISSLRSFSSMTDSFPSTIFPYRLILLRGSASPPLNHSLPSLYRILALVRSIFLFFPTRLNTDKTPIFLFPFFNV